MREKCVLFSMYVKALYPSMEWDDIVTAVKDMIMNSDMNIENVNWTEVGKYVAVMFPEDVIDQEGLVNVVPKRKKKKNKKCNNKLPSKKEKTRYLDSSKKAWN